MRKEIATLVDVIEDSVVQDFIKKRAIKEEPIQEIQDAFEKTFPLQEMNVILSQLKNNSLTFEEANKSLKQSVKNSDEEQKDIMVKTYLKNFKHLKIDKKAL